MSVQEQWHGQETPTDGVDGHSVASDDALSRKEQREQPFYVGRVQVYPKAIKGAMRRIKWIALIVLLGIYYVTPWLRWDRGPGAPDQAVLIDMPARRAYFFWIEIWPQEVYYLTGLLILASLGLFLVTALFGRVWCGYACPQTVWTDLFMWVERQIEGDRNARIRLDKQPWSTDKFVKKTSKHLVWLIIALLTGGAWVMYFNDAPTVLAQLFTGEAGTGVYFFVGLFTATTYLLAGMAREQVCTYMCPWPRIQGALIDDESMIVTYQNWRGDPRGKHKKGDTWDDRGDCVDCKACVAVCPTGIDIRDGMQLECIGCGLCIDACNDIMAKVDRPPELITFDTTRNQQHKSRGESYVLRLIRPRTVVYVVLIGIVGVFMLWSLGSRATIDLNVLHERAPLFVTLKDGSIRNGYTVKLLNKAREVRSFTLSVAGLDQAVVGTIGSASTSQTVVLQAAPDTVSTYFVHVSVPRSVLGDTVTPVTLSVEEVAGGETATHDSVFRGPDR